MYIGYSLTAFRLFLVLVFSLTLLACSSKKNHIVKKIPQRFIDRPYTLPEGADSWRVDHYIREVVDAVSSTESGSSGEGRDTLTNPFNFQFSITDDLSYVITPLPLGLRYQAHRDEISTLGITVATLIALNTAEVEYKYKTTRDVAITLGADYFRSDFISDSKSTGTSIGLMYQVNDLMALQVGYGRTKREESGGIFQDLFGSSNLVTVDYYSRYEVDMYYVLNRKWELSVSFQETVYDKVLVDKFQMLIFGLSHYY
ncbi:MAG: hypothetical protein KAU21_03125 [Gammaproteobacteria bacterium]|nr:hypothetical protein [Gammaproteobacteria bacterium]